MKAIRYSFLVVAFVYLAACSGGTSNYPNWVVSDPLRAQAIAQGEILNLTAAEVKSLIMSRRSSGTRYMASNELVITDSGISRLETICPGNRTCTIDGQEFSLDDDLPSLNVAEFQPLFTRNGIDIWQIRSQLADASTNGHVNNLIVGGILDNSLFGFELIGFYQGTRATSEEGDSFSFGNSPGTNPSSTISSATWTGVMLGVDYSQVTNSFDQLRPLHGDTRIVVEGLDATPTVDVTFTNVRNLNTGAGYTLDGWADIPLSNGFFRIGSGTNKIEGTFYGSEHQEVGGHFEQGRIIGAFGGKRP